MATDRATRWVYVEVLESQSAATAPGFRKRLRNAAPKKVHTIRTDHGTEFTDRVFATGEDFDETGYRTPRSSGAPGYQAWSGGT